MVHCYSFMKDTENADDIRKARPRCVQPARPAGGTLTDAHHFSGPLQQVETALGGAVSDGLEVLVVRDVAPHKEMICISFRVPEFCRAPLDAADAADADRASKRARASVDDA